MHQLLNMYQGNMLGKCTVPDNRTNLRRYMEVRYGMFPDIKWIGTYRTYRTLPPCISWGWCGSLVRYGTVHWYGFLVRYGSLVRYGTLVRFSGTVQFLVTVRYGTFVRLSGTVHWVFRYTCSAQYDSLAQCNWFVLICYCFSIIRCNMWIVPFILM